MLKFKTFNYLLVSLKLICSIISAVWAFKTIPRSNMYFKFLAISTLSNVLFINRVVFYLSPGGKGSITSSLLAQLLQVSKAFSFYSTMASIHELVLYSQQKTKVFKYFKTFDKLIVFLFYGKLILLTG